MANEFIGRKVAVGLGKEATRGTAVAPTYWTPHLSVDFSAKIDILQNESAMGVNEKYNDAHVGKIWGGGSIEGKLQPITGGLLLLAALGEVSTATNADTSGNVYDHTFGVSQSNAGVSFTIAKKDPVDDAAYPMATVVNTELAFEAGKYVTIKQEFVSKADQGASNTVAYLEDTEFTSKNVSVVIADDVAGLNAATPIVVEKGDLKINRDSEEWQALGSDTVADIFSKSVEFEASLTLLFNSTDFENMWKNQTTKALRIAIVDTDTVIGNAANPGFVFTLNKAKVNEWSRDDGLDDIVRQEIKVTGYFDPAAGKAFEAVVTNTVTSY